MKGADIKKKYCCECQPVRFEEKRVNNIFRIASLLVSVLILIGVFYVAFYQPQLIYYNEDEMGVVATATSFMIFEGVAEDFEEDSMVKSIVAICDRLEDIDEKITCVHEIATMDFYYRNEPHQFYTPTQTFADGGVCRDWAVFFKAMYDTMGFKTLLIFPPNHVYLEVFSGDDIWKIDQRLIEKQSIYK